MSAFNQDVSFHIHINTNIFDNVVYNVGMFLSFIDNEWGLVVLTHYSKFALLRGRVFLCVCFPDIYYTWYGWADGKCKSRGAIEVYSLSLYMAAKLTSFETYWLLVNDNSLNPPVHVM